MQIKSENNSILGAIIVFPFLMLFVIMGSYFISISNQHEGYIPAKGRVIDLNRTQDLDHAIIEFQTKEGKTVKFTSQIGQNPPATIGSEVSVLYDPISNKAVQDSLMEKLFPYIFYYAPLLVIGMAGLALLPK